ncbi:unnamed protein product [Protopolystoma xenopodis]|uniref:Uncharacterized protein n=1 Tax=Protopolystoma xenopodis TaxID=117903 RepID=A0A448WTQ4_9PLAT|nr:unnamed protein product [Protopolystoma xenopodis]
MSTKPYAPRRRHPASYGSRSGRSEGDFEAAVASETKGSVRPALCSDTCRYAIEQDTDGLFTGHWPTVSHPFTGTNTPSAGVPNPSSVMFDDVKSPVGEFAKEELCTEEFMIDGKRYRQTYRRRIVLERRKTREVSALSLPPNGALPSIPYRIAIAAATRVFMPAPFNFWKKLLLGTAN